MTEVRGIGSPQQLLWNIGTSLLDAGPRDADAQLAKALAEVCDLVGAASAGIYDHDPATGTNRLMVGHGVSSDSLTPTRPGVAQQALARSDGYALVDLRELYGGTDYDVLGWPEGSGFVTWLEQGPERVVTLFLLAFEPEWGDGEIELLRGFGLLVRQFMRRVAAEGTLHQRRALDETALRIADELQGLTAAEFDLAIDSLLRQVMDAVDGHACFLVDVVDERHFDVPVLVTRGMSMPTLPTMAIDDLNAFTGANATDMLDLLAGTRILDATELTGALLGEESDAYGEAVSIHRSVVLVPTEVAGFAATAIGVSRDSSRPWTTDEIDAVSTIVSMLTQARARCIAEVDSQARFALQQVLTDVGQRFLNVEARHALDAADVAFRDVAESLGAAFAFASTIADDDHVDVVRAWVGAEAHEPGRVSLTDLGLARAQIDAESSIAVVELAPAIVEAWGLSGASWRIACGRADRLGGNFALGFPVDSPLPATVGIEAVGSFGDLSSQLQLRVAAERETHRRLEAEEVLSDIADDFLGGSARTSVRVESRALERIAHLLDLQGTVIGTAPPAPVIERMWRHPDLAGSGPVIGTSVPTGAIPFDELDPNAPVELTAVGDSLTAISLRERWESANLLIAPVIVDGELVAAISAIRHGSFDDRDHSVLRSVAGMLGQFRARVAAEQRDESRLHSEQLLSDFAAELADATVDTLQESVNAAFMNICDAMDLTCLTIWRIDNDGEAYRPVYRASPPEGECADLPDIRPFGADAMLDEVRVADGWVIGPDLSTDDPTLNVVAFRRGSEPRESILITKARRSDRWAPETLDLFREVSGVLRDVEARIAAERYVDAAFDNAPVGIVLRDDRLRLITCNVAFADFLGYDGPEDLSGTMPDHVYAEGIDAIEWVDRHGRLESEAAFRRKDGGRVWGHMRATVVEGDAGDHFWLIHVEDITDRRRAEALLRFQATHDELTGLANRGRLIQELDELAAAPEGVAVLLLDLDRFKNINDSLGHDRGDELLVTIADRLRLAVRPGDLVARLGGDEFAITLAGPVTPTDAEFVANRLLRLIGEPVTLGAQKLYPSASIGIAFSDSRDVADLLRRADTAMYRAKDQGRAQAALFDEALQLEVTERMATEAGLRGALRNSEFLVYYQPEVSTVDGRMLGAEALIRWDHPAEGVLPAAAFIEVAEETGLVVEMGEHVLAQAVAEAATWPGGDDGPMVRVNLAAAQLQRDDTVALVRFALQESGLAPHRLCLEITESAVMTDIRRSEQILHRLKELGVKLAVDDFGTGFSSLAYLKRFPVDALKIDRAFVIGLGESDEDDAFVSSIVSLADALGLDVVAEGVETQEQARILSELGCHRAQGYLYAKPGPPGDLQPFLPGHQDA